MLPYLQKPYKEKLSQMFMKYFNAVRAGALVFANV